MLIPFFFAWVGFSFLAHRFAKSYIQRIFGNSSGDVFALTMSAVLVTSCQLLLCSGLVLLSRRARADKAKQPSMMLLLSIALTHAFGALATNYSMALIPAASTHVLKVLEPIITGGIAWLTIGISENFSVTRVLAVVLVVIGAVGATNYNPSNAGHSFYQIGLHVLPALLSNVLYGSRNVLIKYLAGRRFLFDAVTMGKVSLFGALMLLIPFTSLVMCVGNCEFLLIFFTRSSVLLLIGSALCHVTYTYISTSVILSQISVISHAIANVSKRILVIVLLYIFGQNGYLSPYFLILFCIGLAIYTKDSFGDTKENDKEPVGETILYKHYVVVAILIIASVTMLLTCMSEPGITHLLNQRQSFFRFNNVLSSKLAFMKTSTSEKVKLTGIDRTNNTDITMKSMLTASDAIQEATRIHMEIYKDLMGHYRKAALFGLGDHNNYGDAAISVGEYMVLNRLGIELVYYCSSHRCGDLSAAKRAIENTTEPVLILTSGGGNFCNWKIECDLRARVAKTFKDREIIVFPQSVDFKGKRDLEEHSKAMNVNSNITYLFRDHVSYNTIVNSGLFKYKRAILCPDIAVQIGIQSFSFTPSHDILWIKRSDKESLNYSSIPTFAQNLSVLVGDWSPPEPRARQPSGVSVLEKSYTRMLYGFRYLSRGKVVVTDRLHGHILSVLMNKPNVLLDNSYGKVGNYHAAWTPGIQNVLVASNITDALEKAQYLLNTVK